MTTSTLTTLLTSLAATALLAACMPGPPEPSQPYRPDPGTGPTPAEINCIADAVEREGVEGVRATGVNRLGPSPETSLDNGFEVFLEVPGIAFEQRCFTDSDGNVVSTIVAVG